MPTKILAIDDSKTMRLAIKITFAAEDAKVTAVSKGSEAVARAKQLQADVVLVDHKLAPGEPTGFEVVQALKANPATASIPVILMVPARGGITEAQVKAAGAESYIGKPFDSQELIDKVAAALGRGAAPRLGAPSVPAPQVAAAAAPAAAVPVVRPVAPPTAATAPKVPVAAAAPKLPTAPAAAPVPRPGPAPVAAPPAGVKPQPQPRVPVSAPVSAPPTGRAPVSTPTIAARPVAAATPAAAAPAATAAAPANIPIAIPIPFTAASSPTAGMLERIKAAAGSSSAIAGLDPAVAQALLQLSREIVEQVVWEVVPDLAEEMIKQKAG